ncbi:peroxide stress protein YaaA [Reinekea sp. G2M2-21]|uniref:peroxide stress protein YaaA n=1 Tax=Reinekea sp. G2M2-21 TaxID=2788942 RepID=UPI0018ABD81C|nr:peroxide stress protein YaaA [Reinekea sp. G2M2-21]
MVKVLAVISPAKTLDFETDSPVDDVSDYRFADEAQSLIDELKAKSCADIAQLMSLSEKLAALNVERYQQWRPVMTAANSKQALFAFKGDVYTGLSAYTLTKPQIIQAQRKVRILSGLYGLLRPLDTIQPYRLEMGTKLSNSRGQNLYEFWGNRITDLLNQDVAESDADYLINLASQEYFRAVDTKQLAVPVITPVFLDEKNGNYKIISFFAKKARGLMIRYILDNQPTSLKALKAFDYAGYSFSAADSDQWNWVFKRKQQ